MKHIFFIALLTFLKSFSSFGQCDVCTPDLTCTSSTGSPAICPAQIPDAVEGVFYSQQVTFYLPPTVSFNGSDFDLQDVVITSINGLPAGIDVFFPNNDTTFSPGSGENYACVTLCGTSIDTGVYIVQIVIDGTVNTFFGPLPFPTQNFTFNFNVVANPSVTTGCTNELACNYDSLAVEDDGSCGPILGSICDDSLSSTINDVITTDCLCAGEELIYGCTDSLACNFLADANVDDGTCGLQYGSLCNDNLDSTINDAINSECVCEGVFIIEGCMSQSACNYDISANVDNGSCGEAIGAPCDDNDPASSNDVIVSGCSCEGVTGIPGCTSSSSCNFNPDATLDDGSCLGSFGSACDDGDSSTVNDQVTFECTCLGSPLVEGCTQQSACNFNPSANVDNGSCGIALGSLCDDGDSATTDDVIVVGCECTGVMEILGCTSSSSCNFNPDATLDDGSCLGFFGSACDDGDSLTVNDQVTFECTCLGSPLVEGCTQQSACNYDPAANVDDGSCGEAIGAPCDDNDPATSNDAIVSGCSCEGVTGIPGCTDFLACNFNPQATVDDGSCGAQIFSPCDDGDETTSNDITLPGCDCMGTPALTGCTDPLACNYNPLAVVDDGTCGPLTGEGCDDGDASTSNDIIVPGCLCIGNPLSVINRNSIELRVYPNPTSDVIIVELPDYRGWIVEVYSISGALLISQNCTRTIDLTGLGQGFYTLNLKGPYSSVRHKINVVR